MGNGTNSFDFTVTLTTFLGTSISDGTYSDLLETLKFDQIGQEAAATDIETAAGQLWSNLSDDYVLATYDSFYLATKTWRIADNAARNALGTDDGLVVGDLGYTEDFNVLFRVATVDGASTSTWEPLGKAAAIITTGTTNIGPFNNIFVDASGGTVDLDLPAATRARDWRICVTNAANTVTLNRGAGDTINGVAADADLTGVGMYFVTQNGVSDNCVTERIINI